MSCTDYTKQNISSTGYTPQGRDGSFYYDDDRVYDSGGDSFDGVYYTAYDDETMGATSYTDQSILATTYGGETIPATTYDPKGCLYWLDTANLFILDTADNYILVEN